MSVRTGHVVVVMGVAVVWVVPVMVVLVVGVESAVMLLTKAQFEYLLLQGRLELLPLLIGKPQLSNEPGQPPQRLGSPPPRLSAGPRDDDEEDEDDGGGEGGVEDNHRYTIGAEDAVDEQILIRLSKALGLERVEEGRILLLDGGEREVVHRACRAVVRGLAWNAGGGTLGRPISADGQNAQASVLRILGLR